jgi:signal peptide peptidase SppA
MNDLSLGWTSDCVARHTGLRNFWAVETSWFTEAVGRLRDKLYQPKLLSERMAEVRAAAGDGRPFALDSGGVAVIPMSGPLIKGEGKLGEVNSLQIRRAVRAAAADEAVGAIMLLIDSPGGTVAGTEELARDVRNARARKPTFAHLDDEGASAAYWIASQAEKVTANATAMVGSIGTVAVVEDLSGALSADGIKVHVVSTGAYKGAFAAGAPVLPEHLTYLQGKVDELNGHFLDWVAKGRGATPKTVQGWADGRMWLAGEAKAMGLIDGVMQFDQAMEAARKAVPKRTAKGAIARAQIADAERRMGG